MRLLWPFQETMRLRSPQLHPRLKTGTDLGRNQNRGPAKMRVRAVLSSFAEVSV
jgi:hypothetical protein